MAEQGVTRRLAAILAAEVVGYNRRMGADETGTPACLKAGWTRCAAFRATARMATGPRADRG
ncbi:MAG: hypothetical protein QF893_12670 [Alphaproteobacteria bacterium]|jgi:hypothetical protein|nr:hypothetical protein [Alphaproteobacteria bacterium]